MNEGFTQDNYHLNLIQFKESRKRTQADPQQHPSNLCLAYTHSHHFIRLLQQIFEIRDMNRVNSKPYFCMSSHSASGSSWADLVCP